VKARSRVRAAMSRHIESNPRGQRGLRRVDVDICERGRPIWVHGRSAEVVEDKEATKEAGVGSCRGGPPAWTRQIYLLQYTGKSFNYFPSFFYS
jgi:hypothetical protein